MSRRWTLTAKAIIGSTLLFHAGTQISSTINGIYNSNFPSAQRAAFKQDVGVPITGWHGDIESRPNDIRFLKYVIVQEQLERPITISEVKIRPKSYLKKNLEEQAETLLDVRIGGRALPFLNTIMLDQGEVNQEPAHHEIKHLRTYEALAQHPELLSRWAALATDRDGRSLYLKPAEQLGIYLPALHVSSKKVVSEKNEELGFVTDYARTNVLEDIAEVGAKAEMEQEGDFVRWLFTERNEHIARKVQLAQEYHIIPAEFTEYIELEKLYRDAYAFHGIDTAKTGPFLAKSAVFLRQHPESAYAGIVHIERAASIRSADLTYEEWNRRVAAEYHAALRASYRNPLAYPLALEKLSTIAATNEYIYHANPNAATIYYAANKEYWRRYEAGDSSIFTTGVDDFLIAHGIAPQ